jgi:hypothetical protein
LHQEVRRDAISFLNEAFSRKFPGVKTIPTAENDIKSINTVPQRKKLISL